MNIRNYILQQVPIYYNKYLNFIFSPCIKFILIQTHFVNYPFGKNQESQTPEKVWSSSPLLWFYNLVPRVLYRSPPYPPRVRVG